LSRSSTFRAALIVLIAALAFYAIGFGVDAFDDTPLTLAGGVLTILGLALVVLGARTEQH
jgi:hypothetical protein